jgi:zinc transport system substrate-binding protein
VRITHSVLTLVLLSLVACSQDIDTQAAPGSAARGPAQIYTVNYPLAWAAQQLPGAAAEVHFPAPAAVDPAFWQPDLDTVAAYQQADLILLNGANYARWQARVSLPDNRLVDTSRAFAERLIAIDSGPAHSHGPEGAHSHGELAFTVWLDLSLYALQIEATAAALVTQLPQHSEHITARENSLLDAILALDRELLELGTAFDGAPVLYSHPVYQYFQARYKFNGRALHWEPDQPPSPKQWSELGALLEQHRAAVMLWEDEPLPATRDRLKQLGIEVVVFRPMGNRPADGDFLSGMSANIDRLKKHSPRT